MSSDPSRITAPAAVRIVACRISVAREGNGRYVLGNGSSFGTDRPPGPGGVLFAAVSPPGSAPAIATAGVGLGVVDGRGDAVHATAAASADAIAALFLRLMGP